MSFFVKIIFFIAIFYSKCYSQNKFDYKGTYVSTKPDNSYILTIKENPNHSLFAILRSENKTGYVSLSTTENKLSGIIVCQDGSSRYIEISHNLDTLFIHSREDLVKLEFVFMKIKINSLINSSLEPKLYGKWVSIDDKTNKLLSNQYHIFYPNGDLELVHPKINSIVASDAFQSGAVRMKWATEGNQWYIIYESKLPLPLTSVHLGSFRFSGDTLYTITPKGRVEKSLRDKRFH